MPRAVGYGRRIRIGVTACFVIAPYAGATSFLSLGALRYVRLDHLRLTFRSGRVVFHNWSGTLIYIKLRTRPSC